MKKLRFLVILAIAGMGFAFESCDSQKPVNFKSDIDSVSYILGSFSAMNMKGSLKTIPGPAINTEIFMKSFQETFKDDTLISVLGMEIQAANAYINDYFQNAQNRLADDKKAESDKFLAENRTKSGVITTESGLQYKVMTEGTGPKPKADDKVKVHYNGTLLDGTVFDSTIQRGGDPVEIDLSILDGFPGWKEGIQLMPVGSKYTLWIPMELGFGMNNPQLNELLIFEVELFEIVKNP